MNIIMLGPPGAGKGTVAQHIRDKKGMVQFSTGDALREEVARGTELGRQVEGVMKSGKLVSDDIVRRIVESRLEEYRGRGVILDGYPRNLPQAEAIEEIISKLGIDIDLVIDVEASDETIVKRLTSRRQCPNCKAIYGLDMPPKEKGKCDRCGTPLITREDDREGTVRKRLEEYRKNTAPLVEFYKEKGALKVIDGNRRLPEVLAQADKILLAGGMQ